jgi:hypothetical protein
MEDGEKRGLIGLIVVLLAASGGAALVYGFTDSTGLGTVVFVAILAAGLYKGEEIARFIGGK